MTNSNTNTTINTNTNDNNNFTPAGLGPASSNDFRA